MMRYLSVCAGIEAATCAWHPLGWQPVAFSEVDAFPSAVLAHHYSNTPNVGDMTRIATGETDVGPFDLLVGGTPCQSFSVAGLRKGLADPRGNLALAYLEIARRYRPRWLVWENVPGVLSSNGGRDFGSILGGMVELGYGVAYRVLDAQFFGVPQRRRRVFVVGCLGDWRGAAAVLFERHSLSGHPAPRRSEGEGAAGGSANGVALRGREGGGTAELTGNVATALRASQGGGDKPHVAQCVTTGTGQRYDAESETLVTAFTCKDYGADAGNSSPTLRAMGHDGSHANSGGQVAVAFTGNVTHALNTANNGKMSSEDGTGRGVPTVATPIDMRQASRGETFTNNRPEHSSGGAPGTGVGDAGDPAPSLANSHTPAVGYGAAVRRLTPAECEALQGFPRGYTAVPYRNGTAADSPRYKALGNSMAVPVIRWIGERINAVRATQAKTEAA